MHIRGYIDPIGIGRGFMIPVWENPPANGFFILKKDSAVSNPRLEQIDPEDAKNLIYFDEVRDIVLPLQEYFIFKLENTIIEGLQDDIAAGFEKLRSELKKYPILNFSVSNFLNESEKLPALFAVAYTHMGTKFSEDTAKNWQDSQVFLPAALEIIDIHPLGPENEIIDVNVNSSSIEVFIEFVTLHDFDINSKVLDKVIDAIKTFDPELSVSITQTPASQAWERIAAGNPEQEPEVEDELLKKLKQMAVNLDSYDPEKRRDISKSFRINLATEIPSTYSEIQKTFGEKVIINYSSFNPSQKNKESIFRKINFRLAGVENAQMNYFIHFLNSGLDGSKILAGDSSNLSQTNRLKIQHTIPKPKIGEAEKAKLLDDIAQELLKKFILTFENHIEKLKPN